MWGEAKWLDFKGNTCARMYHPVAKPQKVVVEADTGLFPKTTECLEIEYIGLEARLRVRYGVAIRLTRGCGGKSAVVKVVHW